MSFGSFLDTFKLSSKVGYHSSSRYILFTYDYKPFGVSIESNYIRGQLLIPKVIEYDIEVLDHL